MKERQTSRATADFDAYTKNYLHNPVYVSVMRDTLEDAAIAYRFARILSIVSFVVGLILVIAALWVGLTRDAEIITLIFAGSGTISLISLLLYNPIDRIQSGVNELIKSQIAALVFIVQHDAVGRQLAELSERTGLSNRSERMIELAEHLRQSSSQIIADIDTKATQTGD